MKKIISMILVLAMLFTFVPQGHVYAEEDGEKVLAAVKEQYQGGKASLLTAEEWNSVGSKGDNCWVDANGSMTAADVKAVAGTDADYGKVLTITTTKKADANYNGQIFFKTTGKVKAGDNLFYAFRIKGISNNTTSGNVVTNMRIRPSNGGDGNLNFMRNDIQDAIDDEWTLVWGYADAPANSADSDSVDSLGNKYGAFVLQVGMAQEEFQIADLQIYNLSSTPGAVDDPEETVERKSFEEVMQLYLDGTGTLVTYPSLTDENAYKLERQEPLEDNGEDFVVNPVDVTGQDFNKALNIKTTKTGDQAWDAQIYFNLDYTKAIKKGDMLFFGCKVRGISSVTNKEAMFVTANTRIRPDRSASSNFDITSSINADDENAWTQIYGACTAAAASTETDGAWVFQLGSAIQELEIADVFVINFGNELSEKEMPIMTKSYLGMEEDAQWRKDALERIERIRKQDISVNLVDGNGNPIKNATVSVEQTRHEFGFGTIVNVDEYEKWDAAKQEKFKAAFEQIAHNRAGFENALKHYYVTDPVRQNLIDNWMTYFESQNLDIRGHVLIYGSDDRLRNVDSGGVSTDMENKALLSSDTEEGKAALSEWTKNHIQTYVEKYKGKIYNWDVVNENMTSHDWSDRLGGYDAIVQWYKEAHEADPDIKLTYNDYGILSRDKGHQDYHYELCKYLIEHDAPLTTIGIQGHVSLISPIEIINILDRFSELGKDIEITEFTYEDDDPQFQAQFTKDFMIAVFSEEAVSSITTWGFYQGCMYQPKAAMVDSNFNLKPNGEVWRDMIYNQWWTSEAGTTDADGNYNVRAFKGEHEVTVKVGDVEQKFDITLSDEPVTLKLVCDNGKIEQDKTTTPETPGNGGDNNGGNNGGNTNNGGNIDNGDNNDGNTDNGGNAGAKKIGTKLTNSHGSFKVTSSGKKPTVAFTAPKSKSAKTVTVPATIKVDGVTYKVTSIVANAFKNNKKLTKVTIGKNVTAIGKAAFSGCSKLKSIEIPVKVTTIGAKAFYNCKKLKTVTIKSTKLKSIGSKAFGNIDKTAKIICPKKQYSKYKKLINKSKIAKTVKVTK